MSNEAPQQTLKQPVQPPMQIELQNVKKVYPVTGGEVVALDNISLKIRKGDIFGIIGLSGAGKSTLIRCINRLDTPTEGKILIDGQNVPDMNKQQLRQMRRKVSMIFQQFNLLMQQTVAKNIAYPMECIGVPRAKINARVKELLEVVGLESKAKAYPAQLSGGQQQRVGIARGMATNPPVLLCDEPTSALDASSTKQVMGLLQKLRDESGVTVVIITHEMEVVRDYCDSVTLLEHGRVVQSGPIAKVLESPDSALAEDLVPRPNIDGVEIPDGKALLDISFTSSPGVPTGATVLNLVASLGADVAAGRFESIGEVQVGRLAITVPAYHSNAIRGQLERNAILVREWV